ncbi:CCR4 [Ecytonucleospora hepatopenaei]|uniref:poly(A)-specific ribonuclease n=1 Tax=Ecytonucleospora hepatopenaei TaxID=646526 RepID=A0A1W0E758_9MICR|nr:CCR4 [Ecytonucleospora hepatopenaei]
MTEFKRNETNNAQKDPSADELHGIDMSFQSISIISKTILQMENITTLILNNNDIREIPREIYKLRKLEKLDLSHNKIEKIPPEVGKLINLKELLLNDNYIVDVPMEVGTLYKLENFDISNNPLKNPYGTMAKEKSLIRFCRENNTNYPPPNDRVWTETVFKPEVHCLSYTIGTFNTLCSHYASNLTYAPSWVINGECRKNVLLQSFLSVNMDILCLQEVDIGVYNSYYKEALTNKMDYEGILLPKKSYDPQNDQFKKLYGMAIFWKKKKFTFIEQINVDFYSKIINDKRFKYLSDVHNRFINKTNVSLIVILESSKTVFIIVNVHLYYHPDYTDVKGMQTLILLEEVQKLKEKYGKESIVLLSGDFNSLKNSEVYEFITKRKLNPSIFGEFDYGSVTNGDYEHNMDFYDAYAEQELHFTNFTPSFCEVIDYIFYSGPIKLFEVISPVEKEYTLKTIGLPNIHFPSDHVLIGAKFYIDK